MTQSRFLSLPLEIKLRIYELFFSDVTVTIHPAAVVIEPWRARQMVAPTTSTAVSYSGSGNSHPALAMLQVCRQMTMEAEEIFYRHAMFRMDIMVRRPFVPLEKLYRMRRFCGGAEVNLSFELDSNDRETLIDSKRRKHCLVGPFKREKLQVKELRLTDWISDPILAFMLEEVNQEAPSPITLDMYLSVYSPWVF